MATTYNSGVTPANFTPGYSTNYAAIFKIAQQKILGALGADDRFKWMERGEIGNGTALEEFLFKLIAGSDVTLATETGTNVDAPAYNPPEVRYYKDWTTKRYKTTVSDEQIRKVLLNGGSESVLAAVAVGQLAQSAGAEHYDNIKGLLDDSVTQGNSIDLASGTTYSTTEADIKAATLELKNAISKMTFKNNDMSKAQIAYRCPKERIHLIMPYQYANAIDVNWLAGVFNIDKAQLDSVLTLYDGDASSDKVYVCDEMAYTVMTRLNRMTSRYVEDALYQNYWLITDKLYASSPLFKNVHIVVTY